MELFTEQASNHTVLSGMLGQHAREEAECVREKNLGRKDRGIDPKGI